VELGEVMIDEVLLHLLDVREISGRDLMLLKLNITLITVEFEARNDHRIQDQVLFDPLDTDPGWKKIWIRDENLASYF
jgi:hypothetical protein